MVRLKSRTQCPVNGFQFTQPEIGWTHQTWDFEQMVNAVRAVRQANPRFKLSTDANVIRQQVDEQNALRMQSIRGAESYIVADTGPTPSFQQPQRRARLAGAAEAVKRLIQGASLLDEWKDAGFPAVPREQAEARAAVCVPCPFNVLGHYTRWFTVPVSNKLMKMAGEMQERSLATSVDAKLGTCSACLCPMTAKVQVPMDFIAKHSDPKLNEELHPGCWVLKELTTN